MRPAPIRCLQPVRALFLMALLAAACTSTQPFEAGTATEDPVPPPAAGLVYRVFLVGNGGVGTAAQRPATLALLRHHLEVAGPQSAAVFLGNYTGGGLPDSADAGRAAAEARLRAQLDAVRDHPGPLLFVPGHLDWHGGRGGRAALARTEAFVEGELDRGNVFLPDDGFPGPVRRRLTDGITVLAMDTQWWLQGVDKPFGDTGDYDLDEAGDVLRELDEQVRRGQDEVLLVVGHHPLFSNGPYAGRFPLRAHLLPLPILGSAYPFYRRFIGQPQDLAHGDYAVFRREVDRVFSGYSVIYASAHEQNLQHFERGTPRARQHHLISGSAADAGYVAPGGQARFTAALPGFMSIQYYDDNAVWLEVWTPDAEAPGGRLCYRAQLREAAPEPRPEAPPSTHAVPDLRDSVVVRAGNPAYAEAGPLKRFFLGDHHRDLWAVPVAAPVLDVGREAGGLTPIKLGGRGQSVTMRLRSADGRQYVLRSIDKVAGKVWSPALRRTFLRNLTQDQFAMLHPYGAFIVPPLAAAAGVAHTTPRLFFVPDDPRLGPHRDGLAGRLALLEERPDGDLSDRPSFGHAPEAVGTDKMLAEIDDDNDHRVDGYAYARARLFDMLIGDWDRHADQWRWGAFEPADRKGKIYRPIPRDRDVAFMRFNGLLPALGRAFFDPKYQNFGPHYGYLKGLNKNGLPLDRRLTAALDRRAWAALADSLRLALTDAVIEDAVRQWPDTVYAHSGPAITMALKVRRDLLPQAADEYYALLATVVDVVGSDKHERFEVTRLDDLQTEVAVYKTSKQGEVQRLLYRRRFRHDETREVRLYGLGGRDRFIIRGTARRGLRVVAVGGSGQDAFADSSAVAGLRKRTIFYDTDIGNTWATGPSTRVVRAATPRFNDYNPGAFKYNLARPVTFFGFNKDDGLFLGSGVKITRHGFRKRPHAATHQLMANIAARTQAFNIRYNSHLVAVLGWWNLGLEAWARSPNTIYNFYGLGNETRNHDGDATFYQARLSQVVVRGLLMRETLQGVTFSLGPTLQYTDVREQRDRFTGQPQAGITPDAFDLQGHAGLEADLTLSTVGAAAAPRQGFRWSNSAETHLALSPAATSYTRLVTALSIYAAPAPRAVVAVRGGAAHNIGRFPFFAANTLGGQRNLRGHRSNRFAGRTSAYQNAEVRLTLRSFSGYMGFGTLGALAFVDNGRVWTDGEASRRWHQGYGGGFWVDLFDAFVFSGSYAQSTDDRTFHVGLGFQY